MGCRGQPGGPATGGNPETGLGPKGNRGPAKEGVKNRSKIQNGYVPSRGHNQVVLRTDQVDSGAALAI
jgi:hypothetical protein